MTGDGPLSTAHLPRPDPARGVFETLLVVDGRPIELDAHLDRLAISVRELFGAPAMARVTGPARVLAEARARETTAEGDGAAPILARLRLTVAPGGLGRPDLTAVTAEVDPATVFPEPSRAPALAPASVAGGLGAHKWADRRLLGGAAELLTASPGAGLPPSPAPPQPLLVDSDGSVLETERANLFLVQDGVLATPPADGRILPGVTRARVLEIAGDLGIAVAERSLVLTELDDADELFLSGSVRGLEPLRGGSTTARIADALRRRWLL